MINSETDSLTRSAVRYKKFGDKVTVVLNGQHKIVCPWAEIMTCWALFQEEPPHGKDCEWLTYRAMLLEPISCHRQVLKWWMISREVSAAPKPGNQPFQPTPLHRGGVSPPHGRHTQEGSDCHHFSYQLQLPRLKAMGSKHPQGIDGGCTWWFTWSLMVRCC